MLVPLVGALAAGTHWGGGGPHWPSMWHLKDIHAIGLQTGAECSCLFLVPDVLGKVVPVPVPVPGARARARDANPAKPPEKTHGRPFPLSTPSISKSTPRQFPFIDLNTPNHYCVVLAIAPRHCQKFILDIAELWLPTMKELLDSDRVNYLIWRFVGCPALAAPRLVSHSALHASYIPSLFSPALIDGLPHLT